MKAISQSITKEQNEALKICVCAHQTEMKEM